MRNILAKLRQFFFGVRIFLPMIPSFIWLALHDVGEATINYWKNSQEVVNKLSDTYLDHAMQKMTSEYSVGVYRACYGLASLLYLLIWLAMSWLTVEAFQWLVSKIF